MTSTGPDGVALDHVAHAIEHWRDVWDRYAGDLGARWVSGGQSRGFAPGQVRFANGARIEMLMPWAVEDDDFLARFLQRHGPGPHHLTFKVDDLQARLGDARRAGFDPIGVDLSDPEWMEAFIHPKQATGVVVQLAQSSTVRDDAATWFTPPPDGFPTTSRTKETGDGQVRPSELRWVVHAVSEPGPAYALFVDLLHGSKGLEGRDDQVGWAHIGWDGSPLGIRLVWPVGGAGSGARPAEAGADPSEPEDSSARALQRWLDGRSGRVHHLELDVDEPGAVPDSIPLTAPRWKLGPEPAEGSWLVPGIANHGLALVMRPPDRRH